MTHILQYDKDKLTVNEYNLISETIARANRNDFTVHLVNKKYVLIDKAKVNGYVDDKDRILATAAGKTKKKWLRTFVHESCHMDQCIEDVDAWRQTKIGGENDATEIVFMWIGHVVELNATQRKDYIRRALNVELDCEMRAQKKIREYELSIDPDEYAQTANAYVYFYLMMEKTRKWYTIGKEPYNIKEIWSQMPTDFNNDYTKLPSKYEKLYRAHC